MVSPVDRSTSILQQSISQPTTTPAHQPQMQDSIRSACNQNFSLCDFFTSIIQSLKSFFLQLFGSKPAPLPSTYQPAQQSTSLPSSHAQLRNRIAQIATRDRFIWFYKQEENPLTAFLGNFHPCQFHAYSLNFQCSEAAFQAFKFVANVDDMRPFCNLNGDDAFQRGREMSQHWTVAQTQAWQNRNVDIMRTVLIEKFSQNPELKDLLLATGDAYLVEHIPVRGRDRFWGDDHDGTGQNKLGQLLMEVRGRLGGHGVRNRPSQYNQFLARPHGA